MISGTSIGDNMTMKKISPMKLSRNVTTCRSSQRPISIMKSSPVTFLCAITGLMTALCSGRHNNQSGRGVKALPVKNNQAMKRKSIYKILWRVLPVLPCMAVHQRSRSRHGDNGVYRISCRLFPAPGLLFSSLCAGRGSAFPVILLLIS